jgi:hypothetical protein
MFLGGRIPRILEQDKASPLEDDALIVTQPSHPSSSNVVNRPIQMLHPMEKAKGQGGLKGMLLDPSQIRRPDGRAYGSQAADSSFRPAKERLYSYLFKWDFAATLTRR